MTNNQPRTRQEVQEAMAATINGEINGAVEVTLVGDDQISIFSESKQDMEAAQRLMSQTENAKLKDTAEYLEDGAATEYYAYYSI